MGHKIEYNEEQLEETHERINDHIKRISRYGVPSALNTVNHIASKHKDNARENQQRSVKYNTPHEECLDCL